MKYLFDILLKDLQLLNKYCLINFFLLEIPVPIVILVCEGDIKTISHISEALQSKLPVIILKGSGNAADFVHDLINTYFD